MIIVFLHGENLQGKVAPENTTFWLVVTYCVSHLIRLKDSLISNKKWKEPIDIFRLLHRDNHQGKVAFNTTTIG